MYPGAVSTHRILLTGERGFLGKRVRLLLEVDPAIELRIAAKRLGELEPGECHPVDTVVHLAAWTTKRAGSTDLDRIVDANVLGLRALLRAVDPAPQRFVFASTADVYGMRSGRELSESSPLDPTDAYAASKLLGEHMVAEDACARGYEACALRIGHLYGPGEEAYEKLVPAAIRALMKGRPPTVVGDGRTRRDLLYVDDAAEAIRRLLLTLEPMPATLNLAASETYSLDDIAATLIDIVGFMGEIRYLRDRLNPASVSFDTRLLDETVGEWQRVSLADGLRREVEHAVEVERGSVPAPR